MEEVMGDTAPMETGRPRVAVVGGGISGISAAYNLWKLSHGRVRTVIYEARGSLGGHSVTVRHPEIARPIDIGFQVYNDHTYPTFKQFLRELDVSETGSCMSFAVETRDGFSWGSKTTNALLSSFLRQPYAMTKFTWGLSRFFSSALDFISRVEGSNLENCSIPEFARMYGVGELVMEGFLVPFVSSVWSLRTQDINDVDAYTVLKFMSNHRLLSFSNLQWNTLKVSSQEYIEKFIAKCAPELKTGVEVTSLKQDENGRWSFNDELGKYDHVILALHGDDSAKIDIVPNVDNSEDVARFVSELRGVTYSENVAVVHTDERAMPNDRRIWSSWNFTCNAVTYWENSLQPLGDGACNVFTTLMGEDQVDGFPIAEERRLGPAIRFRHPRDIRRNMEIGAGLKQGAGGLYACGAYFGYGFHEDGYRSGLEVATAIVHRHHPIIRYQETPHSLLSTLLSPFRWLVESLLWHRLAEGVVNGSIGVQLPRGPMRFFGRRGYPSALLSIHSYAMIVKCLLRGELGFCEAYMDGEFTTDNLPLLLFYLLESRATSKQERVGTFVSSCTTILRKLSYMYLSRNNLTTAKRNVARHYDLGNDFFASFLDPTLTYSSALFSNAEESLEKAQHAKYNRLCEELNIEKEDHVLEIGTGWGGFAIHATKKTGCKITTITLSHQQAVFARSLVSKHKLEDRISVLEMDYRHVLDHFPRGSFNVVVSIEMIEAVGPANYDLYFQIISQCSTENARFGIQAITRFEDNYVKYLHSPDFINQYIFPGGCLPSIGVISQMATRNGLVVTSLLNIAKSYALTLAHWRRNFLRACAKPDFPFDFRFRRTWDLYFAMCEAAFEQGSIQDHQIIFAKLDANPRRLV